MRHKNIFRIRETKKPFLWDLRSIPTFLCTDRKGAKWFWKLNDWEGGKEVFWFENQITRILLYFRVLRVCLKLSTKILEVASKRILNNKPVGVTPKIIALVDFLTLNIILVIKFSKELVLSESQYERLLNFELRKSMIGQQWGIS